MKRIMNITHASLATVAFARSSVPVQSAVLKSFSLSENFPPENPEKNTERK